MATRGSARMRLLALSLFAMTVAAQPVQRAVMVEEAFQLSGVPGQVRQLPEQFQQQFDEQLARIPAAQRDQMAPIARKVLGDFIDPQSFYRQLKTSSGAQGDGKKFQSSLERPHAPLLVRQRKPQNCPST